MDDRLYSIQPTPYGGRGIYARADISAGTCILRCPGPYAYVIARKFRKEVCAWCFSYAFEHGKRVWSCKYESTESTDSTSTRDHECIGTTVSPVHNSKQKKGKGANTAANLAGTWFCTAECRTRWCLEMNFEGLHASLLGMLEKLRITASDKKRGSADIPVTAADSIVIEGDSFPLLKTLPPYWTHSKGALLSASHLKNPSTISAGSKEQIANYHQTLSCQMQLDIVWGHAEHVYARGFYRNAAPSEPRKEEPLTEFELDTARFVISALVQFFWEGSAVAISNRGLNQNQSGPVMTWTDMLKLQNNELETTLRKPEILATQLRVYGFVRSVVNTALKTPGVMPAGAHDWSKLQACVDKSDYVRAILSRDHGNVFGIWDMATEGDSEMLGWGMYIQGSYFNHDCSPNVKKRRMGRTLGFYAMRNITTGEELCTTYVDVDEPANQRRAELREQWYFDCVCVRCCREFEAAERGNQIVPIDESIIDSGYVSSVDN